MQRSPCLRSASLSNALNDRIASSSERDRSRTTKTGPVCSARMSVVNSTAMGDSSIRDLADLVRHHLATAERAFNSEMVKLRVAYGDRLVNTAMSIARADEERSRISILGQRQRQRREIAADERIQRLRQRKRDGPLGPTLPPLWR
jgi:hypothetical protein